MFGLRRKNKGGGKIDHLLSLVGQEPENTKYRLRLADLYVRAGDRESAIREYQKVAKYLREEGFNLKAISIYKRIFTLGGMSLDDYRCLGSLYAEEGLIVEARRTYERILQIEPGDPDAQRALTDLERRNAMPTVSQTTGPLQKGGLQIREDDEPIPIEALLPRSQNEEDPGNPTPPSLDGLLMDELEGDPGSGAGVDLPEGGNNAEIDLASLHLDELFRDAGLLDPKKTAPEQAPPGAPIQPPTPEDPETAQTDTPDEDPNLHYHLGVAYREMELVDKAIEEFTKALEQKTNTLECLTMLGRCYSEKGLFEEAATFFRRAMELENLTRYQMDLLRQQLEEVEAVAKLR